MAAWQCISSALGASWKPAGRVLCCLLRFALLLLFLGGAAAMCDFAHDVHAVGLTEHIELRRYLNGVVQESARTEG